jgi:hypothetical protein
LVLQNHESGGPLDCQVTLGSLLRIASRNGRKIGKYETLAEDEFREEGNEFRMLA